MLKNRLCWIIWLLVVGLLHLFGNNMSTRIILIASLVTPILLIAAAGLFSRRVVVELDLPGFCGKGEAISGQILAWGSGISVLSRFLCKAVCWNMLTGEQKTVSADALLLLRRKKAIDYSLLPAYCGKLNVRLEDCRVCDIFGLSAWKLTPPPDKGIIVLPEVFEPQVILLEDITAIVDSDTYSMTAPGFDSGETFAIREYIRGDSIRSIHWKLSQKNDKLMVREFGLPIVNKILILFESSYTVERGAPSAKETDAAAEVFLSVSTALSGQEIPHTVGWRDTKSGVFVSHEISLSGELETIMDDFLSNTVSVAEMTTPQCFMQYYNQCAYAHAVIVSAYVEPDMDLLYNGNRVTVLHCDEDIDGSDAASSRVHRILFSCNGYRDEIDSLEL